MPKLALIKTPTSAHPILAAGPIAVKCQDHQDKSTQASIPEDISYIDQVDMDPMVLACAHDNQEVISSKHMLGSRLGAAI